MPPKSDPRWRDLVSGRTQREFQCLALKILMARLRSEVSRDPSRMSGAIDEAYDFFSRRIQIAQADYKAIFS